jgi:tetratricopeptide (TPR) repeat protein
MATRLPLTVPCALLVAAAALPPVARARAEAGTVVPSVELKTLAGGKAPLLSSKARANVFVFFRPGQERSADALKQLAACEKELGGKPIYWTAVVSGSAPVEEVQAAVTQAGLHMPVLIDEGDVVYDRLGVRLHPVVGIADGKSRLVALEPYRQLASCETLQARIRLVLGEGDQAAVDRAVNPERSPLPGAGDPARKAQRDVNMARRLYEIGQYNDALKFASRALELAPVAHAYTVMGQAHAKLGQCAEAVKALDQAAKLDPKEAELGEEARARCR